MIRSGAKSSDPPREAGLGRDWGTPQIAEMFVLLSVKGRPRIRPEIDCGASRGNGQTAVGNSRRFNVRLTYPRAPLVRLRIINEVEHAPLGTGRLARETACGPFGFLQNFMRTPLLLSCAVCGVPAEILPDSATRGGAATRARCPRVLLRAELGNCRR